MKANRTRRITLALATVAAIVAILIVGSNNNADAKPSKPCPNHTIKKNTTVTVPQGAVLGGDVIFKNVKLMDNTTADITVTQKRIKFDRPAKVNAPFGKGASWVYAGCEGRSKLPTIRYPSAKIFKVPPTVDPCTKPAVSIANEATMTVPSGMSLIGDVKVDSIPLYDYKPVGVKLNVIFNQPARVYAKWGASFVPIQCIKSTTDTTFVISWPWIPPDTTAVTVPTTSAPVAKTCGISIPAGSTFAVAADFFVDGDIAVEGKPLYDNRSDTSLRVLFVHTGTAFAQWDSWMGPVSCAPPTKPGTIVVTW